MRKTFPVILCAVLALSACKKDKAEEGVLLDIAGREQSSKPGLMAVEDCTITYRIRNNTSMVLKDLRLQLEWNGVYNSFDGKRHPTRRSLGLADLSDLNMVADGLPAGAMVTTDKVEPVPGLCNTYTYKVLSIDACQMDDGVPCANNFKAVDATVDEENQ